jgi:DNA invertase Pin-like site-specific DNA recombinase
MTPPSGPGLATPGWRSAPASWPRRDKLGVRRAGVGRLSGGGGQGAALRQQRRALAAACRRHGWRPLEAGGAAGGLAEKRRRRESAEPLRPRERAEAETLLAARRGPLCRLLAELSALIASAQEHGWAPALVCLEGAPAETTPAGEQQASLCASFAPFERRLIAQRTRKALALKRAQGIRLGRPPTISAYALERIRQEQAAGKSLTAIANGLNADRVPTAQGGRRWYPATIRYTLNQTDRPS